MVAGIRITRRSHAPTPANDHVAVQSDFIIRTMTQLLQSPGRGRRVSAPGQPTAAVSRLPTSGRWSLCVGAGSDAVCGDFRVWFASIRTRDMSAPCRMRLEEAVVRGCRTAWPPERRFAEACRTGTPTFISTVGAECVVSIPIRDGRDHVVGIIQFIDEPAKSALGTAQSLRGASGFRAEPLATGPTWRCRPLMAMVDTMVSPVGGPRDGAGECRGHGVAGRAVPASCDVPLSSTTGHTPFCRRPV